MMLAGDYPHPAYPPEEGTHTLTLLLRATRYDRDILYRRFGIIGHIHNVIVSHAIKLLRQLSEDKEYQELKARYGELAGRVKDGAQHGPAKKEQRSVSRRMSDIQKRIGLSEAALHRYAKVQARMFAHHVSSQQVQKEASRVWSGVCRVLYGDGRKLHYKPFRDIDTICGKSAKNGVKFFSRFHNYLGKQDEVRFPEGQICWNGLTVPVKIDYDDAYVCASLRHNVRYCEIKRMPFPGGDRYYVILYLQGPPPERITPGNAPLAEVDPGVSTAAVFSEKGVILQELAPEAIRFQKQIVRLQNQIDNCRRRMNPEYYNEDGTIKKGRHRWKLSRTAKRRQRLLTVTNRKEAAYRRQAHNRLANEIIRISPFVRSEPMSFKALQKRGKKTGQQQKPSIVSTRSGQTISVRKYKRKKRFGRSTRIRAPALFMAILQKKAERYGSFCTIDTKKVKPSQYDHVSDTFVKAPLSCRTKTIGGHTVQRDLYAAFLGYCVAPDGVSFDRRKADELFDLFVYAQEKEIEVMKRAGISMPHCFGF